MRRTKLGNGWALWLHPADFRRMLATAREMSEPKATITELALRLGGESGLRVSETIDVTRSDVKESTHPDVTEQFLKIDGAKDSTGELEGGKYREAILPRTTVECMDRVVEMSGAGPDDPLIPRCKRSIQNYIKSVGETIAESGDDGWEHLSSHDLRRYFASNTLIRHNVPKPVVKRSGGWVKDQTLNRYLEQPTDDVIAREFASAGLVEGTRLDDQEPEPATSETVQDALEAEGHIVL
jgi:integrase